MRFSANGPFRSLLMLTVAFSLAPAMAAEPPPGAQLLQPFKQQLMAALQSGLAAGPEAAIEVCQVQAPAIAASLSVGGVQMGRASHRLRNPQNTVPDWAGELLAAYRSTPAPALPVTVSLEGNRRGYVEPIYTQAQCLVCHGTEVAPEIAQTIGERYPQDQATGFAEGELRGIFWVEYAAVDDPRP